MLFNSITNWIYFAKLALFRIFPHLSLVLLANWIPISLLFASFLIVQGHESKKRSWTRKVVVTDHNKLLRVQHKSNSIAFPMKCDAFLKVQYNFEEKHISLNFIMTQLILYFKSHSSICLYSRNRLVHFHFHHNHKQINIS